MLRGSNNLVGDRAAMLAQVRSFFSDRAVLEVDCPSIIPYPPIDTGIEVIALEEGYLHTSPEYHMKRMLAEGSGDIFYLGHVFRKGEAGRLHCPEFTMIEWYRTNICYHLFIEEACSLIKLFLGDFPIQKLTYREAFLRYTGLDPFSPIDFVAAAKRLGLELGSDYQSWDQDTWLNLILAHAIEPHLGRGELTVLLDYPPSQAALAQIVEREGHLVAERFEIYHEGIELSNGYHELADAVELRKRFEEENLRRVSCGKAPYPLDEPLLAALPKLPNCCGVSIGFDRLMFLRHQCSQLLEIVYS